MIGITIITGFLGAGKTTLLKNLLNESIEKDKKIAIIHNEFTEKNNNIDKIVFKDINDIYNIPKIKEDDKNNGNNNLKKDIQKNKNELRIINEIDSEEGFIYELNNGCLCCSNKSNFVKLIENILSLKTKYDYIFVEVSGVYDNIQINNLLWLDELNKSKIYLDSIIHIVDSYHFIKYYNKQEIKQNTKDTISNEINHEHEKKKKNEANNIYHNEKKKKNEATNMDHNEKKKQNEVYNVYHNEKKKQNEVYNVYHNEKQKQNEAYNVYHNEKKKQNEVYNVYHNEKQKQNEAYNVYHNEKKKQNEAYNVYHNEKQNEANNFGPNEQTAEYEQIMVSDVIILNKIDKLNQHNINELKIFIHKLNPISTIYTTSYCYVPIENITNLKCYEKKNIKNIIINNTKVENVVSFHYNDFHNMTFHFDHDISSLIQLSDLLNKMKNNFIKQKDTNILKQIVTILKNKNIFSYKKINHILATLLWNSKLQIYRGKGVFVAFNDDIYNNKHKIKLNIYYYQSVGDLYEINHVMTDIHTFFQTYVTKSIKENEKIHTNNNNNNNNINIIYNNINNENTQTEFNINNINYNHEEHTCDDLLEFENYISDDSSCSENNEYNINNILNNTHIFTSRFLFIGKNINMEDIKNKLDDCLYK
ncbi:COBW domain-containing protein 1, putative [Plasmodium reichenowi]|uniref:COBW domain-containing protein 1, putative n=1 Tax=Plasmodium reichenowi TaxID=5854 RepID=A0A2P9DN60_PLARE|nr:COBW domain-containing protein 1, putative [Plasmodium reichenowi]